MKFDVRAYSMSPLDMSTSTVYGLWHDDARTPTSGFPLNTWRNNNVVITSKRRYFDVIASKWRRFDVITTSLLRNMSAGFPSQRASNAHDVLMLPLMLSWISCWPNCHRLFETPCRSHGVSAFLRKQFSSLLQWYCRSHSHKNGHSK